MACPAEFGKSDGRGFTGLALEAPQGLVFHVEDREDGHEAGDLEHLPDVRRTRAAQDRGCDTIRREF